MKDLPRKIGTTTTHEDIQVVVPRAVPSLANTELMIGTATVSKVALSRNAPCLAHQARSLHSAGFLLLNTCLRIPIFRRVPRQPCAKRGSSGRFGFGLCFGLACMFFRSLGVHVSPYRFKRCTAHATDEIRPVPE